MSKLEEFQFNYIKKLRFAIPSSIIIHYIVCFALGNIIGESYLPITHASDLYKWVYPYLGGSSVAIGFVIFFIVRF
ncbi:MAG: hypothetical protein LBV08_02855 [Clostridiales bacterium]|jgi:hypothetical protein|nr:hypothetical protein [Clostridiales bacterium]